MDMLDNMVFLDLETTGLEAATNEIIEIGAVKYSKGEIQEYHQLVRPYRSYISPFIFKMCQGLKEEDLRQAPYLGEIEGELKSFIGDYPLICHNAMFEKSFLARLDPEIENPILDSLELFCVMKPGFPKHNLDYLTKNYLKEERRVQHRALEDARDTSRLVEKLFRELALWEYMQIAIEYMEGSGWNWLPYLKNIPPSGLVSQNRPSSTITDITGVKNDIEDKDNNKDKDKRKSYGPGDIEELMRDRDMWEDYFTGYEFREHQLKMALSFNESFQEGQALFQEAPTGSGKTLAYLLVAVLWAYENDQKVFISTNTKNLQNQVENDFYSLLGVLGLKGMTLTRIKGMGNYICRTRVEDQLALNPHNLDERLARLYMMNWVEAGVEGEIGDISYWFRKNNKGVEPLINSVRCRKEHCKKGECRYRQICFYQKKVRLMKRSSLCVVNHSLLLTWPSGFPKMEKLVVDEAHALEKDALACFTEEVSYTELKSLSLQLLQPGDKGYLSFLLYYAKDILENTGYKRAFEKVKQLETNIKITGSIMNNIRQEEVGRGDYSFKKEISPEWKELKEAVNKCSKDLRDMAGIIEEANDKVLLEKEGFEETALYQQGQDIMAICRSWSRILGDCFALEEDSFCRYLEINDYNWYLRITPLDVSGYFHDKVIENSQSIVLTSATLTENGSYNRIIRCLGFDSLDGEVIRCQKPVEPVFDYKNNCVLVLPDDFPGYGESLFTESVALLVQQVARMLGGKTLVLFTSIKRMEEVSRLIEEPLGVEGITCYTGKGFSRQGLVEMFKEDASAVLLGSRGFYEGVDIKGEQLSCVIIDKLSYPFPGDPVFKARKKYLSGLGKNWFQELSLSEATRNLRQQFGRLLRSQEDRGFVMVLDQLDKKSAPGSRIIKELPETEIFTGDIQNILEYMRNRYKKWGTL